MKIIITIVRWILVGFLAIISLGALVGGGFGFIGSILIALSALFVMPISFVSKLRQKFKLNKIVSIILIAVLFVVGISLIPINNSEKNNIQNTDSNSSTTQNQTMSTESSKPTESSISTESNKPTTTTHTHSFSNATCTEAAKCACGTIDESALGHDYSVANCTEAAKCSRCGTTDGSAKGHSWVNATYDTPKTCSICKITEGNPLTVPNCSIILSSILAPTGLPFSFAAII